MVKSDHVDQFEINTSETRFIKSVYMIVDVCLNKMESVSTSSRVCQFPTGQLTWYSRLLAPMILIKSEFSLRYWLPTKGYSPWEWIVVLDRVPSCRHRRTLDRSIRHLIEVTIIGLWVDQHTPLVQTRHLQACVCSFPSLLIHFIPNMPWIDETYCNAGRLECVTHKAVQYHLDSRSHRQC